MSIGIAIIAKNEDASLPVLLSTVSEFAEQIVLVDTGSTDNTVKTALEYGCEIYFASWRDDFSYVRNIALSHMRTEWILSLDCDEVIEYDELLKIRQCTKDKEAGGFNLLLENHLGNGLKSTHQYTRLYRNIQGIEYKGRIHEQIRPSIENKGLEIKECNAKIIHNGYFNNDEIKQIRNKDLLLQEIQDNPNDDWLKYHLANTEFAMHNNDTAFDIYKKVYKSSSLSKDQQHMSSVRLAQIALSKDDSESVVEYTDFTSENKDIEGLRMFVLAAAKIIKRDFNHAKQLYEDVMLISSNLVNYSTVKKALGYLKNK